MIFEALSVIVTATDEANDLKQTVEILLQHKEDLGEIVIVRPDWAAPECVEATKELTERYPDLVRELIQSRPYVGGAIRDGFDDAKCSHLLFLPADLAISLDAVGPMIELEKQFPDGIVKTSRWKKGGGFVDYSKVRLAINTVAQICLKILYQTEIIDHTNPVQILPAELYRSIRWHELNYPFLEELVLAPLRLRVKFREVPCICYGRTEGESKNSFLQTALYLKTALRTRFVPKDRLLKPTAER